MKLSLNWLKDYIDPKLSTEDLTHRLVMAGWEVEGVETVGEDTVFELEITPNRPDCLNILGLAREIGAITAKKVSYPKIKTYKETSAKASIKIEDKKDCCRYIGTLINDVTVDLSSQSMKDHLTSLGIKSISNIVDITNFVLMETGQPLHAFDYDLLAGGKIIVRRAKAGEKIVTIDGVERTLDPTILVIADAEKPVAIAGIMGGKETEVTSQTKNILLESAHFDMTLVRRASRKLGLRSDSSYRFERNVNFNGVLTGANRATDLILQMAGGHVSARTDVSYPSKESRKPISLSEEQIKNLLGTTIPLSKAKRILLSLDFKVTSQGKTLKVTPPDFRADVKQSVDLIEEVSRTIGYDRMPTSLPQIKAKNLITNSRSLQIKKLLRKTLIGCGLNETVTLTMHNAKALIKSGITDMPPVRLFNPLTQDQELMRPSLLPSLLQVAQTNLNRGQKDLKFFEIGKRYLPDGEKEAAAILMTGRRHADWRANRKEAVDFYDLKGVLERAFEALRLTVEFHPFKYPSFEEGQAVTVVFNKKTIGILGKVDGKILSNWDIKNQDIYFAAVNLEEIYQLPPLVLKYQPISGFPAVTRDVSLAVKKEVSYQQIENICRQNGGDVLLNVQFIEQYLGDKVQQGQKALVFSCLYQSHVRTLREEEVNAAHDRIVTALVNQLGATRR